MSAQETVIGIDLGTTYSAIAQVDETGSPRVIPNLDNERTTPSVVHISNSTALVGRIAKELAVTSPQDTVQFVKSFIGRRRKRFNLADQAWTPEEISALILKKIAADAEVCLGNGDRLRRAVITVPAFFNEQQRKSTADAGRIAGLDVLSVINEPTAAALAYGFHHLGSDRTILVYDLGGGTFDITLMRIEGNVIRMMATDGDVQLGGKDWDQRIIDFAATQFQSRHGIDPREHPEALMELMARAEQAKIRLSKISETKVSVNCEGRRESLVLTREKFEEITQDLLAQTEMTLRLTIEEAAIDFGHIDECLLVGGSTRMKSVIGMFERLIGKCPRQVLNPDECVAQGAAIHAVMEQIDRMNRGESIGAPKIQPEALRRFEAMEEHLINSHTLGIQAISSEGRTVVAPVIKRASSIPCRQVRTFKTSRPGQEAIRIAVMEGESENPEACTEIGTCFVKNLPADLPQGTPIEVVFEYTQDSRIRVSATLPSIDVTISTQIERTSGMAPEEIDKASRRIAVLKVE